VRLAFTETNAVTFETPEGGIIMVVLENFGDKTATITRLTLNRPGFCGDSIAWKGRWSHASTPFPEEVPARAA
jgi:hypothetical protein